MWFQELFSISHMQQPFYNDQHLYEACKTYQGNILADMIRTKIYPFHPYYRKIFNSIGLKPEDIQSIDDLQKIPFTTKKELAESPKDFVLTPTRDSLLSTMSIPQKIYWLLNKSRLKNVIVSNYKPTFMVATSGRTSSSTPIVLVL